MNETNFDWDDLRLFLAIARAGGLAAAVTVTGKSAPTLGRRMLALENKLGNDLFKRMPRGYALTEHGQQLMKTAVMLEDQIAPIVATRDRDQAQRVKISAGTWVTLFLCRNISKLSGLRPANVQFISADHVLDISHREAVIGIRNHRPTQHTLAGRRTGNVQFAVYAANDEVDTWARVVGSTPSAKWVKSQTVNSRAIEVTSARNALDMAMAGSVKTVLPTFIGENTSGVHQVSEEIEELEHTQWLVSHHDDRHLPEVRRMIDRVYELLQDA